MLPFLEFSQALTCITECSDLFVYHTNSAKFQVAMYTFIGNK